MQENLNKENYWNGAMERYPNATKTFCEWIDWYKEKVGWRQILPLAKFHDLPWELQAGIVYAFMCSQCDKHMQLPRTQVRDICTTRLGLGYVIKYMDIFFDHLERAICQEQKKK